MWSISNASDKKQNKTNKTKQANRTSLAQTSSYWQVTWPKQKVGTCITIKTCSLSAVKAEMADHPSSISSEADLSMSNGDSEASEEKDVVKEVSVIPRKSSVLKKEGKRSLQKSVSFSSRPEEKKVINGKCFAALVLRRRLWNGNGEWWVNSMLSNSIASDCLAFIQNGCELMKIRSNSRQYQRFFSVDEDLSTLRWRPSTKKPDKAKSKCFFYGSKQSINVVG